ncbi:MAG: aminopeptidase [Leptospiraceae bacterium]|nr:aminopeptidase [Leptospiraceae bacterium]
MQIRFLFLSLLPIYFSNCILYLSHLTKGQIEILKNREKIEDILSEDKYPEWKEKLKLVLEAREFAIKHLGLNPKGGYKFFTKLERSEVGWHVTASKPLAFESYQWWFPIVGSVPYKGYFDLEKAQEEERKLIQEGYDTKLRITSGYSTLGWFDDPLLSPQLKLRNDELVALVIHEMAHATIYFKDDSRFNESYASFVEEIGTSEFYSRDNLIDQAILIKRQKFKKEQDILRTWLKETAGELKDLYSSNLSDEEKYRIKKIIIDKFKQKLLEHKSQFEVLNITRLAESNINNETFIGVFRYHSGEKFFRKVYEECNQNFFEFQNKMRELQSLSKSEREKLLEEN